jgi:membrane protease YdiL (CAAX protease family)
MIETLTVAATPTEWSNPSEPELRAAVLYAVATVLYLAYHLAVSRDVVARLFPRRTAEAELRTTVSFFRKGLGTVLFGVVPAIAIALAWPGGLARCGMTLAEAPRSLAYAAAFVIAVLPLVWSQSKKPAFRRHYPEVRIPFTPRVAGWNALAWTTYLVAYELFFRGILVLGLAPEIGALPALAISLMAYVFVHLGRYPGETVGSLVTGTLFSLVALETGSLLMPVVAHLGVALGSDHLAARPLAARPVPERADG